MRSAAAALDITLTHRGKHLGAAVPMCGVPYHASESYLQRLIKAGFRVAICEQTEDPAEAKKRGSKSVVRREVVRLVTAGTLNEDSLLDAKAHNFIAAFGVSRQSAKPLGRLLGPICRPVRFSPPAMPTPCPLCWLG